MSEHDAFNRMVPVLQSMHFKRIKRPDLPVREAVHEGYVFANLLKQDKDALESIGFDTTIIGNIEDATATMAIAQAKLLALMDEKQEAVREWHQNKKQGLEYRNFILKATKFACRDDRETMAKLNSFSRQPNYPLMILDLHTLAELGKKYESALSAINISYEQIAQCRILGLQLNELYAKAFIADGPCEMRVIRDKAFTYLKLLTTQSMKFVKYLYPRYSKRRSLYSSAYRKEKYRRKKVVSVEDS